MEKPQAGNSFSGKQAVVIGASMAGLLSARALVDHFESVIVIERDALVDAPEPRKGVPQSRQTHALLEKGVQVIGGFFPGFWEEMVELGAVKMDFAKDFIWFHHGAWKVRMEGGPITFGQSRPLIEYNIRRRLQRDCPRVRLDCGDVVGLSHDSARGQVTGVRLRGKDGTESVLEAQLVVDASGRGTRGPRWLEELGYGRPPEEHVKIDICYATRTVQPPPSARDWKAMMVYGKAPHEKRLGYIFPIEGGNWSLTLGGYHGDHPGSDEAGFMEFARSVHHPVYFEAMKEARPVSPIAMYKVPSDQRYYYERMARFPDGYVAVGDAICSFNPIFGQGMTTAALGASTLSECLSSRGLGKGFSREFQKRTVRYNDDAWKLVSSEDFRYPETEGARPPVLGAINWYLGQLLSLASVDNDVQKLLLQVNHMQAGLTSVFRPRFVLKALMWGLGLRGNRALVVSQPPADPARAPQPVSPLPERKDWADGAAPSEPPSSSASGTR